MEIVWNGTYITVVNYKSMGKKLSSIITIQDINNSEILKWLVLYYPLNRRDIDTIAINKKISGTDNITETQQYSNNLL